MSFVRTSRVFRASPALGRPLVQRRFVTEAQARMNNRIRALAEENEAAYAAVQDPTWNIRDFGFFVVFVPLGLLYAPKED
jgi:hypothetical protein